MAGATSFVEQLQKELKKPGFLIVGSADDYFSWKTDAAIKAIVELIEEEIAGMTPSWDVGGPVARAHVMARHALWYAMGGKALAHAIDNRRRSEVTGLARATSFVECGVGVGGEAQLIAADGGRVALHRATLSVDDAPLPIVSLSFGVGSLMHPIWPDRAAADDYWELGFHIESAVWLMWWASADTQRQSERLFDTSDTGRPQQTQALDEVKERLATINQLAERRSKHPSTETPLIGCRRSTSRTLHAKNRDVVSRIDISTISRTRTHSRPPS